MHFHNRARGNVPRHRSARPWCRLKRIGIGGVEVDHQFILVFSSGQSWWPWHLALDVDWDARPCASAGNEPMNSLGFMVMNFLQDALNQVNAPCCPPTDGYLS